MYLLLSMIIAYILSVGRDPVTTKHDKRLTYTLSVDETKKSCYREHGACTHT